MEDKTITHKQKAWYGPGGALVTDQPIANITGPEMVEDAKKYYGASYLIAESMTASGAKAVAEAIGLEYEGITPKKRSHANETKQAIPR